MSILVVQTEQLHLFCEVWHVGQGKQLSFQSVHFLQTPVVHELPQLLTLIGAHEAHFYDCRLLRKSLLRICERAQLSQTLMRGHRKSALVGGVIFCMETEGSRETRRTCTWR